MFSNLLQLEQCKIMFKVIFDIIAHWYEMWNTILITISFSTGMNMICALMIIISKYNGIKCRCNLLPWTVVFKVISDITAHWYDFWNTIVIVINLCKARKMICALMFVISNHWEIKCLSNLIQLKPCSVIYKVTSDIITKTFNFSMITYDKHQCA